MNLTLVDPVLEYIMIHTSLFCESIKYELSWGKQILAIKTCPTVLASM